MSESHFETLGLRAMGDRLALQAFCAPIQSTSFDEKVERLREALSSKGKRPGDLERTTSEHAPRLKKAPKETLKIEFAWKHHLGGKYVQIRKNKGGGNRTVDLMRNAQYDECLKKAQELFFPDMSSQYGIYADMEARLANYNAEPIDDNHFSVGNYRKATGMNLPRVYLMTKAAKIKDRGMRFAVFLTCFSKEIIASKRSKIMIAIILTQLWGGGGGTGWFLYLFHFPSLYCGSRLLVPFLLQNITKCCGVFLQFLYGRRQNKKISLCTFYDTFYIMPIRAALLSFLLTTYLTLNQITVRKNNTVDGFSGSFLTHRLRCGYCFD